MGNILGVIASPSAEGRGNLNASPRRSPRRPDKSGLLAMAESRKVGTDLQVCPPARFGQPLSLRQNRVSLVYWASTKTGHFKQEGIIIEPPGGMARKEPEQIVKGEK